MILRRLISRSSECILGCKIWLISCVRIWVAMLMFACWHYLHQFEPNQHDPILTNCCYTPHNFVNLINYYAQSVIRESHMICICMHIDWQKSKITNLLAGFTWANLIVFENLRLFIFRRYVPRGNNTLPSLKAGKMIDPNHQDFWCSIYLGARWGSIGTEK